MRIRGDAFQHRRLRERVGNMPPPNSRKAKAACSKSETGSVLHSRQRRKTRSVEGDVLTRHMADPKRRHGSAGEGVLKLHMASNMEAWKAANSALSMIMP